MNYQSIVKLQKESGAWEMQEIINSGNAWKMEGSYGRAAMAMLESGECMLPKTAHKDYYGNFIPSRLMLEGNTKGTYLNSLNFYSN